MLLLSSEIQKFTMDGKGEREKIDPRLQKGHSLEKVDIEIPKLEDFKDNGLSEVNITTPKISDFTNSTKRSGSAFGLGFGNKNQASSTQNYAPANSARDAQNEAYHQEKSQKVSQ